MTAVLGPRKEPDGSLRRPRDETAEKLLTGSLRHSYDPVIDIDWDAPLHPDLFWLPPHRSSLYGTPLWTELSHRQRVELTRQEVAAAASAGIWFETILMQMLVRHYYDQDPTTAHAQYALTEVADECRHSVMFGRLLTAMGVRPMAASRRDHLLGRVLKATATGPHMYGAILLAEEILDAYQREIMADESLQPLIRMVCRVHVVEEARHVKFAREEIARQVDAYGPVRLAYSRLVLARAANTISRRLIHPGVYGVVGVPDRQGHDMAMRNPAFRETLRWSASKAIALFTELGLMQGTAVNALWRRSGLV